MPSNQLDPIDRQILAELQADGRMTNVELASRVGISAPPCLRRVRVLEEQGYIKGYHADVDARCLGLKCRFSPWSACRARRRRTSRRSRRAAAPGRSCVNATCSTARWTSF